jgi:uncharacterized protein
VQNPPSDVAHLNWLYQQIGDRLVDRIGVYTGRLAYRRPDGVAAIPPVVACAPCLALG